MVEFHSEGIPFELTNTQDVSQWIEATITAEKASLGEINCVFCSDDYLLQMNQEYLEHDYYTDIITFDYCDGSLISGDLFISIDRVRDNAEQMQLPFLQELSRVIIHGVLHLLGYGDKQPESEKTMRQKEDHYLSLLSN